MDARSFKTIDERFGYEIEDYRHQHRTTLPNNCICANPHYQELKWVGVLLIWCCFIDYGGYVSHLCCLCC